MTAKQTTPPMTRPRIEVQDVVPVASRRRRPKGKLDTDRAASRARASQGTCALRVPGLLIVITPAHMQLHDDALESAG